MSDELIKIVEDSGIVTITLNRPDRLNALFGHMRRDLAEALEEAGSDPDVRVIVITGEGRAFCAGGDVNFMAELVDRGDSEEFARLLGAARRVILAIRHMTKPVVASINGPASGAGFNLALACDLRIASASATFSQSFVKLGFHPDWGGSYFLPRMVPSNIACEMFFLGDSIDAQKALQFGLVNRIVDATDGADFMKQVMDYARQFTTPNKASRAVGRIKRAVQTGAEIPFESALALERELQQQLFQSEDAKAGLDAYVNKRKAEFKGR